MTKLILFISGLILLASCSGTRKNDSRLEHVVKDASGRLVSIPEKIDKIIALRSGSLRLLAYMDVIDRIIAVEENEQRRTVPYLYANPVLKSLPIVGTGNIAQPELLAAYNPDVIFCTYFTAGEARELQNKTGIPVVVLDYGDFNQRVDTLYNTFQFLGNILNKEARADSLIRFIKDTHQDLLERGHTDSSLQNPTVYIGGVAYRGAHGINSTEPRYAPFRMLKARNVASELGEVTSSPKAWLENAFIDIEQLIIWNPDIIFLDVAGKTVWSKDINKEALQKSLKAIRENNIYLVLPHNWYTTNYENILCNAYYIGKVLYPENFSDIDIRNKANEIYYNFLGEAVYDSMMHKFNAYKKLQTKK